MNEKLPIKGRARQYIETLNDIKFAELTAGPAAHQAAKAWGHFTLRKFIRKHWFELFGFLCRLGIYRPFEDRFRSPVLLKYMKEEE